MAQSYEKITNTLNFSVSLNPTSAFPLDARSMFGSYEAAVIAAASAENAGSANTVYYIGQQLTVFENGIVSTYLIQPDKTLKAVGAEVIGDNKSVVIGNAGSIGLKSFGVNYYAYHGADNIIPSGNYLYPDTMPEGVENAYIKISDIWYVYKDSAWALAENNPITTAYYELVEGWKEGLEPKVIKSSDATGFELAWYEPSSTTVEGLNSSIAVMQTTIDTLSKQVVDNKSELIETINSALDDASTAISGLNSNIKENSDKINKIDGDVNTEGSVRNIVAAAIAGIIENPDDTMNSINELVTWTQDHAEDALELSNNVTANSTAIKAIESLLGTKLPDGAVATNVIDYISELVNSEKQRALNAEKNLDDRLKDIENVSDQLKSAAFKEASEFATSEQGAKADTAVQTVVSSSTNGNIVVDGQEVKAYELEKASVNKLGGIIPDGTSISVDAEGKASVAAVHYSKVTGLNTALEENKNSAVNESKKYTEDNAVLITDITTADNMPSSVEAASDGKVISEKIFLDALTWHEGM